MPNLFYYYKKIKTDICRNYYTKKVKKQCKRYGKNLRVNNPSNVTWNTIIKNNVNFNGMDIHGNGQVIIGNYFHSGIACLMITQNHKYDGGNAIPYDNAKYICKRIIIEDFVWLGSRVTILPGVKDRKSVV